MGGKFGDRIVGRHMRKLLIGALALAGSFAAGALIAQTTVVTSFVAPLVGSLGGTGHNNGSYTITLTGNLTAGGAIATMTSTVGGLVPTPPNDATKYLDGTGNFSTPAGSGVGCLVSGAEGFVYNTGSSSCDTLTGITASGSTITAGVWNGTALTSTYLPSDTAYLDVAQSWTKAQRATPATITISTATFTPNFDNAENFTLTLVHASCPCTLANPSTSLVAGQSGVFEIHQSSTGSDTIGTWGSDYQSAGGTASITLSTGASAVDYLPYYVNAAATAIILGSLVQGPTH